jgi:carboxylesterase type B
MKANTIVSASGVYGTWAFQPVTDGIVIQKKPSDALAEGKLNGVNHLSGNNAEEAPYFADQRINTEEKLIAYIKLAFPLLSEQNITALLSHYPSSSADDTADLPKYATSGTSGATAVNVSQSASGQQQRADNIYAETTLVCPSYWLADAYTRNGRKGYKYQYSVPWAAHGADATAYFGEPTDNQGPDLVLAFEKIWGNFVRTGNPSIDEEIAIGASSNGTGKTGLKEWPAFTLDNPTMANLNQTGGEPYTYYGVFNVTMFRGPGLRNDLSLVDGYAWEGGRGGRCDFWRSIADLVPE